VLSARRSMVTPCIAFTSVTWVCPPSPARIGEGRRRARFRRPEGLQGRAVAVAKACTIMRKAFSAPSRNADGSKFRSIVFIWTGSGRARNGFGDGSFRGDRRGLGWRHFGAALDDRSLPRRNRLRRPLIPGSLTEDALSRSTRKAAIMRTVQSIGNPSRSAHRPLRAHKYAVGPDTNEPGTNPSWRGCFGWRAAKPHDLRQRARLGCGLPIARVTHPISNLWAASTTASTEIPSIVE